MCKKAYWYARKMLFDHIFERFEERRKLGHYDYTLLYGAKPWPEFVPYYQPVKKNRPGAYEFWLSRDHEPLFAEDAADWREHAPILHDILVKGKKPIYENAEDEEETAAAEDDE